MLSTTYCSMWSVTPSLLCHRVLIDVWQLMCDCVRFSSAAKSVRVGCWSFPADFVEFLRLYAVGGRDGSSCLRSMECFDPHTNKWSMCAPMAKRRGGVGVATYNNFLYAVGGHDAPASNHCSRLSDCVERLVNFYTNSKQLRKRFCLTSWLGPRVETRM